MTADPCREYEGLLARAADDALDAVEKATLSAHLATCANCQAALAGQRAVHDALAVRPFLYARPDFATRVLEAADAERSWLERLDFRVWTWRLVPVAAALSLVAWFTVQATSAQQPTSPATTATASTTWAASSDLPVAAALWDSSISDADVLSLMLTSSAGDRLADSYKER